MTAKEFAQNYLEDLLSFFGLNTKVDVSQDEHTVELQVPSSSANGFLIGQHGENLRSLQHLTNMALKRGGYEDTAVVIDVAGYKKQRNERLSEHIRKIGEEVKESGEARTLEPMSAYERRVVHQAVSEIDGVSSSSTGEGRDRRVVIEPS